MSTGQNTMIHEPSTKGSSVHEPVEDPKQFLVSFDENDPADPQNWSLGKKWWLTVYSGWLVLLVTFASSAPAAIIDDIREEFHLSNIVAVITISLFVAGYCVGPLLWGPLSEEYGRRPVFIGTFAVFGLFQVGNALATNTAQTLVFRFLGGVFAAAPITNSGALVSDIWNARDRGKAMPLFSIAPFAGPALGPVAGGFVAGSSASWRWLYWGMAIAAGISWLGIVLFQPETYRPLILVWKARRLRKETGDERYHAQMEKMVLPFKEKAYNILAKPFKVFIFEPMLIAMTVYNSFIYGCLYLIFEAYPIVFIRDHGLTDSQAGLMYLSLPVGASTALILYVLIWNPRYVKEATRLAPNPVPPEFRLHSSMVTAPFFGIAFFWFAWTSYPSIHWAVPMLSGVLVGFCIAWIYLGLLLYIVDAYLAVAASALAANAVVRSLVAATFPLFTRPMYESLGPRWAGSLLGFVGLAMVPIPWILIKYGPYLRSKSRFVPPPPIPEANVPSAVVDEEKAETKTT